MAVKTGPSSGFGTFPASQKRPASATTATHFSPIAATLSTTRQRPFDDGAPSSAPRLCRVNADGARCDAATPLPLRLSHGRPDIGESNSGSHRTLACFRLRELRRCHPSACPRALLPRTCGCPVRRCDHGSSGTTLESCPQGSTSTSQVDSVAAVPPVQYDQCREPEGSSTFRLQPARPRSGTKSRHDRASVLGGGGC